GAARTVPTINPPIRMANTPAIARDMLLSSIAASVETIAVDEFGRRVAGRGEAREAGLKEVPFGAMAVRPVHASVGQQMPGVPSAREGFTRCLLSGKAECRARFQRYRVDPVGGMGSAGIHRSEQTDRRIIDYARPDFHTARCKELSIEAKRPQYNAIGIRIDGHDDPAFVRAVNADQRTWKVGQCSPLRHFARGTHIQQAPESAVVM